MERIGVIVVHGIGEQKRFEFLETIATNIYKAAKQQNRSDAHISVRHGDQVPHSSPEPSWRNAPVRIRWTKSDDSEIELSFREVHWADLDMRASFTRFIKLFSWAVGMAGVRLYTKGRVGSSSSNGMCDPRQLKARQLVTTRILLFLTSLAFLLLIVSVGSIYWVLRRLSIEAKWLRRLIGIIYDYLGDVKLYQDWSDRSDNRAETLGEKSRVSIRRRMIQTLVEAASDVESGALDGYFVLAHSLAACRT